MGGRIREARRGIPTAGSKVVSQEQFAQRLGVHWVTVSSWERGKSAPTLANLVRIAEETGKPVAFFTDDDEEEAAAVSIARGQSMLADLMAALDAASEVNARLTHAPTTRGAA